MTKQDFSISIKERIKQVTQIHGSARTKAELMKRNRVFKRELDQAKKLGVHYADNEWPEFCQRWGIAEEWNGDMETLINHASATPWIYINRSDRAMKLVKKKLRPELKAYGYILPERGTDGSFVHLAHHPVVNDLKSTMFDRGDKPYPDGEIYLKIFPWTTLEDLKYVWLDLENTKIMTFGFSISERQKRTFARDLCFYDLHTQARFGKMSDGKIAAAWYQHTGKRVKRDTIKKARARIAANIKALAR